MERSEIAIEKKHAMGLNCCQAVLLAFAPEIKKCWGLKEGEQENVAEKALMALGSGFGSGMGSGDATCGALVGAGMVASLLNKGEEKQRVPSVLLTRAISKKFKEQTGALRCADIKGLLCSCDDCVRYAIKSCEELALGDKG